MFSTGEGLPHTAATHLVGGNSGREDALFVLCHANGTMSVVQMALLPYAVHTHTLKSASLINRLFTGFVPGMFKYVKITFFFI